MQRCQERNALVISMHPSEQDSAVTKGPVLLTGTPYSGTTWIGKQLRDACNLSYFQEPWNPHSGLVGYDRGFHHHHQYVNDHNAGEYLAGLRRLAAMRPMVRWRNLLVNRRLLLRELAESRSRLADRRAGRRPLWKDPIALLSSGWIARTFDSPVLLMVRDPVSFVRSAISREGPTGRSGLAWLATDREFMSAYGAEFHSDLVRMDLQFTSPVERWALVWRLLMTVATRELEPVSTPVVVVRYEDCLANPSKMIVQIASGLGLPLVADPEAVVARHRDVHAHDGAGRSFNAALEAARRLQSVNPKDDSMIRSIVEPLSSIWYESSESRSCDTTITALRRAN